MPAAGWNFDDTAGSPLHVLAFGLAALALLASPRRGSREIWIFAACCACGFILFNAVFAWQVYHATLQLPLFVLGSAFFGAAVERIGGRAPAVALAGLLIVLSTPWLTNNLMRPLFGEHSVVRVPRFDQHLRLHPELKAEFVRAAELVEQAGCRSVDLSVDQDSWEYPFWAALDAVGWRARIQHAGVVNYTSKLEPSHCTVPTPACAEVDISMAGVVVRTSGERTDERPGPLVSRRHGVYLHLARRAVSVRRMEPAELVVIGLDAAEPALLERWAAEGRLPAIARLRDGAFSAPIENPPGIYTGAVWPCLVTGASPARHGRYFSRQLRNGTYDVVDFPAAALHAEPFWEALSRAGWRSAVLDVPKAPLSTSLAGVQLCDWGTHDAEAPPASRPRELAREIARRFGGDPVGPCDLARADARSLARLRDALVARAARKAELALDVLGRGGFHLFFTVFAESHCAGHQLWHVHDPEHPRHRPELARALGDPLLDVYRALDAAVGRLVDAAGPRATVVLFASHGMGAHYDGTFLLDEVLRRLDGLPTPRRSSAVEAVRRAWRRVPARFRSRLQPLADRVYEASRGADRSRRRFFQVPTNDNCAGIRLNLEGREPAGRVERGAAADALCAELERELLTLVEPHTGRPLVRRVLRTRDVFHGERLDDLPDLLVQWHRDAPVRGATSERIGTIAREYAGNRTGDHRAAGLLLARGPRVAPGRSATPVAVTDLAPSFAARLGVELGGVDGRPIAALAGG